MLTRRKFIGTTLGAGAALAAGVQRRAAAGASKRTIVDAQIHLWKAESDDWKWVPGMKPQLPEPFTIERALPLMDEAGVDRAVDRAAVLARRPQRLRASKPPSAIPTASPSWAAFRCRIRNRRRCCRNGRSSRACSACA